MIFNRDFLRRYTLEAPLALAFERVVECRILSTMPFERPILDIGCGEGLFAKMLFAEKIDTGIDPNPREIERARELDAYHELIVCKGDAISKPGGHFRTIFSNSVVEHIPDLEPVLREAYRLLPPGGRLYLTVPSDRFDRYTVVNQVLSCAGLEKLAARFRSFYNRFWKHYHFHSLGDWENIARRAGFTVVTSHTYGPKSVCLLNDMLAPFGIAALITKRLFNRWTLFPALRRLLLYPVCLFAERILRGAARSERGGLVFLALTKS
jgi:SAM-dependent methyltransferase